MPCSGPIAPNANHWGIILPYKDKAAQKKFQRDWCKSRREEYFNGKSCRKCGTIENLELHHKNPEEKTTHRIWSWTKKKEKQSLQSANHCVTLAIRSIIGVATRPISRIGLRIFNV